MRAFVFFLLLASGQAIAQSVPVPMGEAAFTAYMAQRLKAATASTKIEVTVVKPLELKLKAPGDLAADVYLERLYRHCQAVNGQCEEGIRRYVQGTTQTFVEEAMPVERKMLRAIVRPTSYVTDMKEVYRKRGSPPVLVKPYVGELWMILAVDLPSSIRLATATTVKELGLSEAEGFAEGLRNVRDTKKPILQAAH